MRDIWYRVYSSYDGIQESFTITSFADVSMEVLYLGNIHLFEQELYIWTGGYEWTVQLHRVIREVKPLTTPAHHLLPRGAAIDIVTQNCDYCIFADNLVPDTQYFIRARAKNSRGWSEFSDIRSGTPRAILSTPTNVHVDVISGGCLEVEFDPPVYGLPLTAFVLHWDYNQLLLTLRMPCFHHAQVFVGAALSLDWGRLQTSTKFVGYSSRKYILSQ